MKQQLLMAPSNRAAGETDKGTSFLKHLREKKKVSRTKLSRLTQLSTYQVEGLEGKGTQNILSKIFLCTKALGYKTNDVLNLIESGYREKEAFCSAGMLGRPRSETLFQDGVKLLNYLQENGSYFGQLQLAVGKSLAREHVPSGDIVLGIVREGTLVIDVLASQSVHKKDQFFVLPGSLPVHFINGDGYAQASALIFSVRHPH